MNERDLFIAALDITGPDERARYLDQACGPASALRKRVERLLYAHSIAGDFLQRSVLEQLAAGALCLDAPRPREVATSRALTVSPLRPAFWI